MELIGSLFLVLALVLVIALFVGRPFYTRQLEKEEGLPSDLDALEHNRSSLLAERDRVLSALQELEFDYTLGKIPSEDYPEQRAFLLKQGSQVLRQLDEFQPGIAQTTSAEDRIEAAVAARRADAAVRQGAYQPAVLEATASQSGGVDNVEEIIASRRRQRQEKSAGFCPRCGRSVQKSDKFCARCGTTL
jgi:hypothetical protein